MKIHSANETRRKGVLKTLCGLLVGPRYPVYRRILYIKRICNNENFWDIKTVRRCKNCERILAKIVVDNAV